MATILCIETATDICSVGIAKDGKAIVEKKEAAGYSHARSITLLIDACRTEAGLTYSDLEAVAVSTGPGSYTALRIGTATAKGLCYALEIPMLAVDTLTALAMATAKNRPADLYAPMIDARRMEVYTALYDADLQLVREREALILEEDTFTNWLEKGHTIALSGNGAAKIRQVQSSDSIVLTDLFCDALHLMPLAEQSFQQQQFESIAYFEPTYLKPPNITKPKKVL